MNVKELANKLDLKVYCGSKGLDNEITGGYTSDLLSDVMGNSDAGQVWITLQTHKNILAIASLKELAAVILVKGLEPESDTSAMSELEGIPILISNENAFEITGKVYQILTKV